MLRYLRKITAFEWIVMAAVLAIIGSLAWDLSWDEIRGRQAAQQGIVDAQHDVAEGRGTAGLLVRDERLYEAAVLSMERLSEVMNNLLVITGKIKEDGYITVGKAPSGVFRKQFPVPPEDSEAGE